MATLAARSSGAVKKSLKLRKLDEVKLALFGDARDRRPGRAPRRLSEVHPLTPRRCVDVVQRNSLAPYRKLTCFGLAQEAMLTKTSPEEFAAEAAGDWHARC
jgi:hypothetical protein